MKGIFGEATAEFGAEQIAVSLVQPLARFIEPFCSCGEGQQGPDVL